MHIKLISSTIKLACILCLVTACRNNNLVDPNFQTDWQRVEDNPVFRDSIPNVNYEAASDGHIFYDENGKLSMIYTGDSDGKAAIKLARGNTLTDWSVEKDLLFLPNDLNTDLSKETSFYRRTNNGKHQIYYVGYEDEETYRSQIFLAEADSLDGEYIQFSTPLVSHGTIANEDVYCMTSPSVIEHEGLLYLMFIAWNDSPSNVSKVWIMGATSADDGYTWTDFQIVETPIGMEGQVTKNPDGSFVAVRTGEYEDAEALFYSTSDHPFGPWTMSEVPILAKNASALERDEIIAPQITFDPNTGEELLFYTGADYQIGWWMMLARKE